MIQVLKRGNVNKMPSEEGINNKLTLVEILITDIAELYF